MRTLSSGVTIAGRYELQDLVSERYSSMSWRAHDAVLQRSVGIQAIGVDDERVPVFLAAARVSATVNDPRFLRVLDIIEEFDGHTYVIREWARAYPLDHLLSESPLSNVRAAQVVQEVAEALTHAHNRDVYHRYLTPHGVLLKRNGAVRISGLATAAALAGGFDPTEKGAYENHDVDSLGWLLYACLTGRWPGGPMEGLRAAPRDHGKLLRPRQVTAGVSRDVDTVCDRILGDPPQSHQTPLRSASDIARALRGAGHQPFVAAQAGSDVSRLDPVVIPSGPPPGIEPPRRRPKALEPPPPTALERGRKHALSYTRGHRALIAVGIVGVFALAMFLLYLSTSSVGTNDPLEPGVDANTGELIIEQITDFDPQGDETENPQLIANILDDDADIGWRTSEYYGGPSFEGTNKEGVGIIIDLGGHREVGGVELEFAQGPVDLTVFATRPEITVLPDDTEGLRPVASVSGSGRQVTFETDGILTRYLVVWITRMPEVRSGTFQAEVRSVTVMSKGALADD